MHVRLMGLGLGLAILGLAAGCGSGEDGRTSGSDLDSGGREASLTKSEFIQQANTACNHPRQSALERATAYFEQHRSDGLSEAELSRRAVRKAALLTVEAEIKGLRSVGAPLGEEEEISALIDAQEAAFEEAKRHARNDEDVEKYFPGAANEKLLEYRLTGCLKGAEEG